MGDRSERDPVRRQLARDGDEPGVQVARAVADIEGKDPVDLTEIYGCIDGVLDHVFSDPPAPEARLETAFTYEGYRIRIEQDGTAEFVKTT